MTKPSARLLGVRRARVGVASDQALVGELVLLALDSRGYDPVRLAWPRAVRRRRPGARHRRGPWSRRLPDVALLVCDLTHTSQVELARELIERLPVPWVVLASTDPGPGWGAMYDAGARLVIPSSTGLAATSQVLEDLVVGKLVRRPRRWRELVGEWREFDEERRRLEARMALLSEREGLVLLHLHRGDPVREIAREEEVSEATVRTQVRSILRKLDTHSQVAAVAAYERVAGDLIPTAGP